MSRLSRRTLCLIGTGLGMVAVVVGPSRFGVAKEDPAQGPPRRPAVRLLPARPMDSAPDTARGAPVTSASDAFQNIDPFQTGEPAKPNGSIDRFPKLFAGSKPGEFQGGFGMSAAPQPPRPTQQPATLMRPETQPIATAKPTAAFGGVGGWVNDRAKGVKSAIFGASPSAPPPRVGQAPQPQYASIAPPVSSTTPAGSYGFGISTNAKSPPPAQPQQQQQQPAPGQSFQGTTPNGNRAYAGNPAYRWYGWGTTTPGANPYAPSGEYPAASANWFSLSRATPGAFPIPVAFPFRASPNNEAPVYAAAPSQTAPKTAVAAMTPPTMTPPLFAGPKTIAETSPYKYIPGRTQPAPETRAPHAPDAPSSPDWRSRPVAGFGIPAQSAPNSSINTYTNEPGWQQVVPMESAPVQPRARYIPAPPIPPPNMVPVVRGQQPTEELDFAAKIREAGTGLITKLTITELPDQPRSLRISFHTTTRSLAEIAVRAMSNLPELKAYSVEFRVSVQSE